MLTTMFLILNCYCTFVGFRTDNDEVFVTSGNAFVIFVLAVVMLVLPRPPRRFLPFLCPDF